MISIREDIEIVFALNYLDNFCQYYRYNIKSITKIDIYKYIRFLKERMKSRNVSTECIKIFKKSAHEYIKQNNLGIHINV